MGVLGSPVGSSCLYFVYFTWSLLLVRVVVATTQLSYTQKLDHFGHDDRTFQQRVYFDDTLWGGAGAGYPMFVFFGGESPVDDAAENAGILAESVQHFRGLLVSIEHRFYGKSIPLQSIDLALADPEVRSYFTIEQALQDFAEIILSLRANLSAISSPIVVMGGSYSGMLAAWFRLKYPDIAKGALASSAPMLSIDNTFPEDALCSVVDNDFKEINAACYSTILQSWKMIDDIASRPDGLELLSRTFQTCGPLQSADQLKDPISQVYMFAAQYNGRFNDQITSVCDKLLAAKDPIMGLVNVLSSVNAGFNCQVNEVEQNSKPSRLITIDSDSMKAWSWQMCSEFIVPRGCGDNMIMPPSHFDISSYMDNCKMAYGVQPRPNWTQSYFGGNDMKAILSKGSNIIFSNGLRDPLSSGGVLEDLSDTILAVTTREGSHCLDLGGAQTDDPKWLKQQREQEMTILARWIYIPSTGSNLNNMVFFCTLASVLGLCFNLQLIN